MLLISFKLHSFAHNYLHLQLNGMLMCALLDMRLLNKGKSIKLHVYYSGAFILYTTQHESSLWFCCLQDNIQQTTIISLSCHYPVSLAVKFVPLLGEVLQKFTCFSVETMSNPRMHSVFPHFIFCKVTKAETEEALAEVRGRDACKNSSCFVFTFAKCWQLSQILKAD